MINLESNDKPFKLSSTEISKISKSQKSHSANVSSTEKDLGIVIDSN